MLVILLGTDYSSCYLLYYLITVNVENCNDCVILTLCPRAMELLRRHEREYDDLIKNAFCGWETKTPQVCCSKLSNPEEEVEAAEDQAIANHTNLKLLPEDCGHIATDSLVGGNRARLYEFPWMALIASDSAQGIDFRCVGSIINKRYVLTAAQCLENVEVVGVRVGEYDISTDVDCYGRDCNNYKQDLRVEAAVIHENFERAQVIINDIALIRLAEDIDFNRRNVHRICLPTTSELRRQDVSNKVATMAGWKKDLGSILPVLQKATVPILTTQSCQDLYNWSKVASKDLITSKQLCAGGGNMHACSFRAGSPLMLEESNNNLQRYVQYGILSCGPIECGSKFPEIYTDVTKYMKWILDNIRP